MKLLLTLPLLALVGLALAEGDSTSTNCINGHCITCRNGVCSKGRKREASSDQSSSFSQSCTRTNGHETCTVCTNGVCHTTSNRSAEDPHEPVAGCTIVNNVRTCTGGKRSVSAEDINCTTINGVKFGNCKRSAEERGCYYEPARKVCGIKRSAGDGPTYVPFDPCYYKNNVRICGGKRSAEERGCYYEPARKVCGIKRSAQDGAPHYPVESCYYKDGQRICGTKRSARDTRNVYTQACIKDGHCIECNNGHCQITKNGGNYSMSKTCNGSSCTECNEAVTDGDICKQYTEKFRDRTRRSAPAVADDVRVVRAKTCLKDGVCTECVNGNCTASDKKSYESSSNTCINDHCIGCYNGRMCKDYTYYGQLRRRSAAVNDNKSDVRTRTCIADGHCTECVNGRCELAKNERNFSISITCRDGECSECAYGTCKVYGDAQERQTVKACTERDYLYCENGLCAECSGTNCKTFEDARMRHENVKGCTDRSYKYCDDRFCAQCSGTNCKLN